jgi:hypothetical protein
MYHIMLLASMLEKHGRAGERSWKAKALVGNDEALSDGCLSESRQNSSLFIHEIR